MRMYRIAPESTSAPKSAPRHPRRLAALALAPVLLVQGLHVRRTTPRLAEPPGARAGRSGRGPELRLLIAGDSAAAGVGAASQEEALSGALAGALGADFTVCWKLDAKNGWKTADMLARLGTVEPEPFDVALLSLGVNDVTGGTRSAAFVAQQKRLVTLLKDRFCTRLVLLTALPPMHVFPALPQPLRGVLGGRARHFTELLRFIVAGDSCCELLIPRLPLDPAYMAADGFHPGPLAYAEWGRTAARIIRHRCASVNAAS